MASRDRHGEHHPQGWGDDERRWGWDGDGLDARLAALCLACTWLATRAFRSYQRSI